MMFGPTVGDNKLNFWEIVKLRRVLCKDLVINCELLGRGFGVLSKFTIARDWRRVKLTAVFIQPNSLSKSPSILTPSPSNPI